VRVVVRLLTSCLQVGMLDQGRGPRIVPSTLAPNSLFFWHIKANRVEQAMRAREIVVSAVAATIVGGIATMIFNNPLWMLLGVR
jgi:hypothetical protein